MNTNEYLKRILDSQTLKEGSDELAALRESREEVETLLREDFGSAPTIRYGGSKAKGTMILESYDLDLICYFDHDDECAGSTLAEIYIAVLTTLQKKYIVERKTSALRLRSAQPTTKGIDLHIDVVPGRYVDDSRSDCFLYQVSGEKQRLKTNLQVHIDHVKESGVIPAIRLLKLWRVRRGLPVKHFVFELLVIEFLSGKKAKSLADQLEHFWKAIVDEADPVIVTDPANPEGNDLSPLLGTGLWGTLRSASQNTLRLVDDQGWEALYGALDEEEEEESKTTIQRATAAVLAPSRPWRP